MPIKNLSKTPWPYFGGKSDAAPAVWEALGDVEHYAEPFAGSLAVLLRRPHPANRSYFSETVNDMDGFLVNAFRAIQHDPEGVAAAASYPVFEADMHARHLSLLKWRDENQLEHLMGDPDWYDTKMAGWWMWGQSCWIGSGWCSGRGAWIVGPDGRITKSKKGAVSRKMPVVTDDGRGANHPHTREPGVSRQMPSVTDDGRGSSHSLLKEFGVSRQMPDVSSDGRGVYAPRMREEGVSRQIPHVSNQGQGVNHPGVRELGTGDEEEFHPMTMPELTRWMKFLSARLRHVRVLNGDWERVVTTGVLKTLSVRQGGGKVGIFLDPPYSSEVREETLYTVDSGDVSIKVREWCKANGNDPMYRIVLAGYDTEHAELEALGWRAVEWYASGFLKGGYAGQGKGTQQARERLWLSPNCLGKPQSIMDMFGG